MPRKPTKPLEVEIEKVSFLKAHVGLLSSLAGVITIIVTAVIAVEARYANASDVKEMVRNQGEQIKLLNQNNARSLMFQYEYYDNAIKQRQRSTSGPQSPAARREAEKEIEELQFKREVVKRQLIEQK